MMKHLCFFYCLFLLSCNNSRNLSTANRYSYEEKHANGTFLIEINIPMNYYSRFDQMEQGNLIIKYDSTNKHFIDNYINGIFLDFRNTDLSSIRNKLISKGVVFDTLSLNRLSKILQKSINDYVISKTESLVKLNGNMFYLEFTADVIYIPIGKTEQMIPKLKNYACCYSNIKKNIPTNVILRIDNFNPDGITSK